MPFQVFLRLADGFFHVIRTRNGKLEEVVQPTIHPPYRQQLQRQSGCKYATFDSLGGTMEKRLPISMVVNLAPVHSQACNGSELTYTDNVSTHGACVLSSHPWKPGDVADVTSLVDQTTLRGKVVHCHKRGDDRYAIGLIFQRRADVWSL